jgi:hypothetical protein
MPHSHALREQCYVLNSSHNPPLKNGIMAMDLRSDSLRIGYITLSLPCGEQNTQNPLREVVGNHR